MKRLFLASFASVSLELIEELLPKPAGQLKAAFIPTAAGPYENKDFVDVDREALQKMGMNVFDIDLKVTRGDRLQLALRDADVICVAGGNVFYLLDQMRKSGFDVIAKKLIENGVVYVGSSAGSVICCPTIAGAIEFDDPAVAPDLKDHVGLNLVDFVIIPHAQKEKYRGRIERTSSDIENQGFEVKVLTDTQAVIVNDAQVKIMQLEEPND